MQKFAACFVFMILGGFFIYNTTEIESEAGIFDWVKDLFIEEDESEEQLVIITPDATMKKTEMKEGHLPKNDPLKNFLIFLKLFVIFCFLLHYYNERLKRSLLRRKGKYIDARSVCHLVFAFHGRCPFFQEENFR